MIVKREHVSRVKGRKQRGSAGEEGVGVGVRGVGRGGGQRARLRCYGSIICGQAWLLKSKGLQRTLGWPRAPCLCMYVCVQKQKTRNYAPS